MKFDELDDTYEYYCDMQRWQDLMYGRAGRVHKCNGVLCNKQGDITRQIVLINKRRRVL
jgi:hypothetical protein